MEMGELSIKGGAIRITQIKTGAYLELPMPAQLIEAIDAMATLQKRILYNSARISILGKIMVSREGLEPSTIRLKVECSTS